MPDEPRDWRQSGLPPELDPRGPRRDPAADPSGLRGSIPRRPEAPPAPTLRSPGCPFPQSLPSLGALMISLNFMAKEYGKVRLEPSTIWLSRRSEYRRNFKSTAQAGQAGFETCFLNIILATLFSPVEPWRIRMVMMRTPTAGSFSNVTRCRLSDSIEIEVPVNF